MTAMKEITDRLDDIKGLLQELVSEKKRQGDQQLSPVVTPPLKKAKWGDSSSSKELSNGSTQVNMGKRCKRCKQSGP
jgi:hypothetical protein